MRDGLQIEDPIPLAAKLEHARGGRRHRRAGDRGHRVRLPRRRCPRSPMPPNSPPSWRTSTASSSPRLSPARTAPNGRSPQACTPSSTWCRPPTATAAPTSASSTAEAVAQIADIIAIAHDSGASVEVIIATAWDCPFDGPTPPQRVLDIVKVARRQRRRPARDRRHHRHHDTEAGHRPGRPGSPADRRHPARRALPQHPRRRAGQCVRRRRAGITRLDASVGRARRLPVRAGRERQHRHRGPGLSAAGQRNPRRCRPRGGDRRGRRRADAPSDTNSPSALLRAGDRLLGE